MQLFQGGRLGDPASVSDYRVAVFGAGGVGKSSIVQRFVKGTFSENYVPTIEDTYRQMASVFFPENQVWDRVAVGTKV
ncbi:unnamed protein product [Haemonchus placei]|uniref:GTP-binding protein Di-Ras2 n=1 Tax=Haemonchus placei TaxID=6290 RepID=A0A0N4WGE3_HAEPC|nr:unnamed protein product [Haemonchus placei]